MHDNLVFVYYFFNTMQFIVAEPLLQYSSLTKLFTPLDMIVEKLLHNGCNEDYGSVKNKAQSLVSLLSVQVL